MVIVGLLDGDSRALSVSRLRNNKGQIVSRVLLSYIQLHDLRYTSKSRISVKRSPVKARLVTGHMNLSIRVLICFLKIEELIYKSNQLATLLIHNSDIQKLTFK